MKWLIFRFYDTRVTQQKFRISQKKKRSCIRLQHYQSNPRMSLTKTRIDLRFGPAKGDTKNHPAPRHRSHLSMERQLSTSATMPAGWPQMFRTQRWLVDPIHMKIIIHQIWVVWWNNQNEVSQRGDVIDRWESIRLVRFQSLVQRSTTKRAQALRR